MEKKILILWHCEQCGRTEGTTEVTKEDLENRNLSYSDKDIDIYLTTSMGCQECD